MPAEASDAPVWKSPSEAGLGRLLGAFVQAEWYLTHYPDIASSEIHPLVHFVRHGATEWRDPNPWFDTAWYARNYPDAADNGSSPLLHYVLVGAAELRNPHPRFDAAWYAEQHPEAAGNPLLFHLRSGAARAYPTEKPDDIADYLPSRQAALALPPNVRADVIIPVHRGLEATRRCIESVLADAEPPLGRVIVVDDRSPAAALVASPAAALFVWLTQQASLGRITLIRDRRGSGFAAAVNLGVAASGDNDIVVLRSDASVPSGWLKRLAAQAHAEPRIAAVSPFSSDAGFGCFPHATGPNLDTHSIDAACQTGNRGRSVDLPAASGCCVYFRREALADIGTLDAIGSDPGDLDTGHGSEIDFCLRAAAKGWRIRLACDVFVGRQQTGRQADPARTEDELRQHNPAYAKSLAWHASHDPAAPARFAVTAALFRQSGLPVILMVVPGIGGGVRHHVDTLMPRFAGLAHVLLLEGSARGAALSAPSLFLGAVVPGELAGAPIATLPSKRVEDMAALLRSMAVSRVHIHHLVHMDMDIRQLIHRLEVPFDITAHDYHAICPQIVLLPWPESLYCGEPDAAACNTCIAVSPSAHEAMDILVWRREKAWQFLEADRVICPSADVKARLARFGLAERAIVVPHEPVPAGPWKLNLPRKPGPALRVVLLGTLANHKGSRAVAALARTAPPGTIGLHVIGYLEDTFPREEAELITATGRYDDSDLPGLLRAAKADVVWLPSTAPETYSYTLSAAIEAGLPIVATNLGAFTERLAGRPYTWLTDYRASTEDLLAVFDAVRAALRDRSRKAPSVPREAVPDFYATDYLVGATRRVPAAVRRSKPLVVVVPERNDIGRLSPCAYIRLLHPLDHPSIGDGIDLVLADAETVLRYRADVIVTQRYALADPAGANALVAHARETGAHLVYDLDDDLLNIPRGHPDAQTLRPRAQVVRRLLEQAGTVWLSTTALAERVRSIRPDAEVIENGLDERIWAYAPADPGFRADPVRIVCMGTSTHDRDFALIQPALVRLKTEYGDRVSIDVIGMTGQAELPGELNRMGASMHGNRSYPAFVDWINGVSPAWHIGLAPLLDTPFNRTKSSIKAMDYAAMGLVVLASDIPVYRGSLADGPAGRLVANDPRTWFEALSWMVRAQDFRHSIAAGARAAFLATSSLGSQARVRRAAWVRILRRSRPGLTMTYE
jgi:GT2 family glycosyltransferase/glycosyltransferase involved in cell wall biosynthesis